MSTPTAVISGAEQRRQLPPMSSPLKVSPSGEFTPLADPGGCGSRSVASRCDTGRAVYYLYYVSCSASGSG
jgi:hypothetical protein